MCGGLGKMCQFDAMSAKHGMRRQIATCNKIVPLKGTLPQYTLTFVPHMLFPDTGPLRKARVLVSIFCGVVNDIHDRNTRFWVYPATHWMVATRATCLICSIWPSEPSLDCEQGFARLVLMSLDIKHSESWESICTIRGLCICTCSLLECGRVPTDNVALILGSFQHKLGWGTF